MLLICEGILTLPLPIRFNSGLPLVNWGVGLAPPKKGCERSELLFLFFGFDSES